MATNPTAQNVRRPEFLERALGKSGVGPAGFMRNAADARLHALAQEAAERPAPPPPPPAPVVAMAEVEERMRAEFTERVGAAIDLLRIHGERLAAEARVDAVEIAFVVARKIIDAEISQSVGPLVGMVRTAVRRLGESRRIAVRLCPQDADAVASASAARGTSVLSGVSAVAIEVIADNALERGDCVVDGDFGSVDARLGNRLEELRRAVLASDLGSDS